MATVLFPQHARWYAPLAWYQELGRLLPEAYLVNAGGEVTDRMPGTIARFVADGGIWLDYCGQPMYYRDSPLGPLPLMGDGFQMFLASAALLFRHSWRPQKDFPDFPFPRSLVVEEPVVPGFIRPNWEAPTRAKVFSCFGLKVGKGWYFYAYAEPAGRGVHPYDYARFAAALTGAPPPPAPPPPPPDGGGLPPWLLVAGAACIGMIGAMAVRKR